MNKFHSRHQTGEEEDGVNIFTFDGPTFEDIWSIEKMTWERERWFLPEQEKYVLAEEPYSYMLLAQGDEIHLRD